MVCVRIPIQSTSYDDCKNRFISSHLISSLGPLRNSSDILSRLRPVINININITIKPQLRNTQHATRFQQQFRTRHLPLLNDNVDPGNTYRTRTNRPRPNQLDRSL
ncbi:hypothetical protein D9758_018399 [Tetrapyrgos nigripes]|uniref:Uncharacterized protein n=1 Tax=Tetrapyrgos nigripes TaxID=182062 RepID=A0A8H5BTB7_9AGAR|nr:hypothetical protein D9758_018399 [Tetrapyrgos nigripes]